jgi:hypothetical protein
VALDTAWEGYPWHEAPLKERIGESLPKYLAPASKPPVVGAA